MITGQTRVLAIVGDPIVQARAPALVNGALATRGQDAVMVPLHVGCDDLSRVVGGFRAMRNLAGVVVTMPHKTAIVPLLDDLTAEAQLVGACNVVRRETDGRLVGTMLDGEGFVAALRRAGHDVRGKRVFLAGAGGAAAAIAFAMAKHGAAALTIHNRTRAKADALTARVAAARPALAASTGGARPDGHDLVINATSLGMQPGDALPLDVTGLVPGSLVAEVVIRDEPTPLLAAAAARGCLVQPGRPMLVEQIELMVDFILGTCDELSAR